MSKGKKQIEVTVTRHGNGFPPMRRITPKRTVRLGADNMRIIEALRDNRRVELMDEKGAPWMQIQTMCNAKGELVAVAQIYKSFIDEVYYDTEPRFVRKSVGKGKVPITREEFATMREEAVSARRKQVPHRIVTCPKCGCEFELSGFGN